MQTLTLYSRQGCHLCEDMFEQLEELRAELNFSLDVRDIDTNSNWHQQFDELVPVLMQDDTEICRYFLDKVALEKSLV